jgi:hypothetical protein
MPIMIDFQPARQEKSEDVIIEALGSTDIYIILFGHTYGSILEGKGVSYTEWEYTVAQENEIHTIRFLEERQEVVAKRSRLSRENEKERKELDNETLYNGFYSRLEKSGALNNYWSEAAVSDFSRKITNAINRATQTIRKNNPHKGLIPATYYENIEITRTRG